MLGFINLPVRITDQVGNIRFAFCPAVGITAAGQHAKAALLKADLIDLLLPVLHLFFETVTVPVLRQHDDFISAETEDMDVLEHRFLILRYGKTFPKKLRHAHQNPVAGLMSVGVIQILEIIHVHHQNDQVLVQEVRDLFL